jgi:hypothetical protein
VLTADDTTTSSARGSNRRQYSAAIQLFPATGNGDVAESAGFCPCEIRPDGMPAP